MSPAGQARFPCRASKGLKSYEAWTQGPHRETFSGQDWNEIFSFIHVHSKSWTCGIYIFATQNKKIYDCMTLFLKWSDIGNLISTRVEDARVSKMCLLGTGHGRPRIHASLWVHPTTMKEPYCWIRGLLCSTVINVITTIYCYMNIYIIINNVLIIVIVILF